MSQGTNQERLQQNNQILVNNNVDLNELYNIVDDLPDLSDATATVDDIAQGKTAYINGGKKTGTLMDYKANETNSIGLQVPEYQENYNGISTSMLTTFPIPSPTIQRSGSKMQYSIQEKTLADFLGLTGDKIKYGERFLDVTGTYKGEIQAFGTVEEMELHKNFPENTLAVVMGTRYVGTYKMDNGEWTQIGDESVGQEIYSVLEETIAQGETEYEGLGGTDQKINEVLDYILGIRDESIDAETYGVLEDTIAQGQTEFEGIGGTEEEVTEVLDNILGI